MDRQARQLLGMLIALLDEVPILCVKRIIHEGLMEIMPDEYMAFDGGLDAIREKMKRCGH